MCVFVVILLATIKTRKADGNSLLLKQFRVFSNVEMLFIVFQKNRANKSHRFLKRLRHVLIFSLKTCFDVANIIVSYKIFEKPLDFIRS